MWRLSLVFAAAGVALADRTSFDCPMRQMVIDYAAFVNPTMPAMRLQQIADALNSDPSKAAGCTVNGSTAFSRADAPASRFGRFPLPAPDVATFYVDPVSGNDNNNGGINSPFATLQRGLVATRGVTPNSAATLILRNGTFFLTETINIGSQDSMLTIQAYPGEEVWLSRGTPLVGVTWTPTSPPRPPPGDGWITQQNENAVYAEVPYPTVLYNGTYDNYTGCLAACQANFTAGGPCTVWTWHDQNTGSYALQCYFRSDGVYSPTAEADHVSGYYAPPPNVYKADLSSFGLDTVTGLRQNGLRMVRARYPNANPEQGFGSSLSANYWFGPNMPVQPAIQYRPAIPARNDSNSFQQFQLGIGGICGQPGFGFNPPLGYWCGNQTEGGGAFTWRTPVGMIASSSVFPNQPYANPAGAIIQAWHPARWASRMYLMGTPPQYTWNPANNSGTFMFAGGGFQDARGSNNAGNLYIENVWEELDAPTEWFFDTNTSTLYFWANGTAAPPTDGSVVALKGDATCIFNISASQEVPLVGFQLLGLGFRDAAYTFMDDHTIPSGGDWALAREAAVIMEGTENTTVSGCVFERLDGHALMISGYNRYATVTNSEFVWIGDSAIISWGRTRGAPGDQDGPDGTDGNQPRFNTITYNFIHELGIYEKQSSCYMQAKTSDTLIQGVLCFNGPRAGINFNDGFGGGNVITQSIVFSMCRESGDHGPFNSWDRQVFQSYRGVYKAYDHLYRNFMIANFESQEGIDNDDGSAYYNSTSNFLVYSGNGMKSDFGGHDNRHANNVYGYIGKGFGICPQLEGHEDWFTSNYLVQDNDGDYGNPACSDPGKTVVGTNTVLTPTGSVTECGMSLAAWQAKGNDPGTSAGVWPSDTVLLATARAALGMP